MRRAFDSILRNLQRLAWTRLGVPADVAEWFISLDEGDSADVDTLFFQVSKNIQTAKQARSNCAHFPRPTDARLSAPSSLGFIPQRGIGKGESVSSLLWVTVYDILLY